MQPVNKEALKKKVKMLIEAVNRFDLPEEEKRLSELEVLLKRLESQDYDDDLDATLKLVIHHYEKILPLQKLGQHTKFIQEYLDKNG
jgi:hypothetical protein